MGSDSLDRLSVVLAGIFGTATGDVDVSSVDEFDSRNWEAHVSCEYEGKEGDLQWSLSVYITDAVRVRPSEGQLAVEMARILDVPVLFPYEGSIPSVRRLADPDGHLLYARIQEPETDSGGLVVLQVERPVAAFPAAEVSMLADVVREHVIPTPIVEGAFSAQIALKGTGAVVRLWERLLLWERLTYRLAHHWPPSGWYAADMYIDDLRARDEATLLARELGGGFEEAASQALIALDAKYDELTVDDGGKALLEASVVSAAEVHEGAWYWRRRPRSLPWRGDQESS
ncbi:hypothetical protein [Streptomyces zagrosensis]|uniref:Uncharacterized protein n=1 Tax=Streptomyces zagrosensis TaxID=1042984 RepID=A0A7W9Q730_9ACTN|nr:hypothetical protein [Streptomyces zagrosensis]MBB5933927.1 hypothetical protein [Streptomyces zagrosensis]